MKPTYYSTYKETGKVLPKLSADWLGCSKTCHMKYSISKNKWYITIGYETKNCNGEPAIVQGDLSTLK